MGDERLREESGSNMNEQIRRVVTGSVDRLLDVLVVPGFSVIGSTLRRRWWPADAGPFPGPVDVVVTGAGSGLGEAAAGGVAELGARVHLVGRNADRLTAAAARIRAKVPAADLLVHQADVSDLDSVRDLADTLTSTTDGIHGLIHNAGVIPTRRTLTAQGHETAFATHVLGPFALTFALLDQLRADQHARVIWVSSGGMYTSPLVTDLEFADGEYKGVRAYARTKRMQVVLAEQLARHFGAPGDPVVHSMHPGWAATPGISGSIPGFAKLSRPLLRTPADGADTVIWLAAGDRAAASSGEFWHDRKVRPTHALPWHRDNPAARNHLWQACLEATGVQGR